MLRSSQPLTTMGGRRSREDEKLVNATLEGGLKGIIVDTRSQAAAMNSRAKGSKDIIFRMRQIKLTVRQVTEISLPKESRQIQNIKVMQS